MKRWFLALALVAGGLVGIAHADYVIIIANVGQSTNKPKQDPNQPGGGFQGFPGGGMVGGPPPGGMVGGPPGGMIGRPGGMAGGPPPGGGMVGGPPPGGMVGGPPGGMIGRPGGMAGGPPPGGVGGPPPPGGSGGGPPPMGFMGGGIGGPGAGGTTEEDPDPTALYIVVVVESKSPIPAVSAHAIANGNPAYIDHKWGKTVLAPSERVKVQPLIMGPSKMMPSVKARFDLESKKVHKDGKPDVDGLLKLAEWALSHGLLNAFATTMDEVVAADKNHRAAVAWTKVKAELDKAPAEAKDMAVWKDRLGGRGYKNAVKEKGHYTLLAQSPDSPEVQSRLNRLEDSFHAFYYFFALKGVALPVPQNRLLAVVVSKEADFDRVHQMFDGKPLVTDGFLARRDNLTVYSANRLDESYLAFKKIVEPHLANADTSKLIKGQNPDYALQTAYLMLKALEDESELTSVSHETPRQLLAASGLLPRTVAAPQWAEFGIGSFFETAKGSPWTSFGAPSATLIDSQNYLLNYQAAAKKKNAAKPEEILEGVITDKFFHEAAGHSDPQATMKARTYAWALTYFLAQVKTDGLLQYYQELSKLPRDLEFDDEVLKDAFNRAFGLKDKGQVTRFALEWHQFINNTPIELKEVLNEVRNNQNELRTGKPDKDKGKGGPTGPPTPGGPPGPGGFAPPRGS